MKRDLRRRSLRSTPHHAGSGQAITELALLGPIIAIMLLGIVEMAGAFQAKTNLQAATAHADRVAAMIGNNGLDSLHCPSLSSGIVDDADKKIIQTVLNSSSINQNYIEEIDVYKAGVDPGVIATSGGVQLINRYTPPFIVPGSSGTYTLHATAYNWPSCTRQSSEPADSIAVHVTYDYHPITPLFGRATLVMNDQTVERVNPAKNDSPPCPVPSAPSVVAQWQGSQPSTNDTITVNGSSDTTSIKVYASSSSTGGSSTLVGTISGSSGTISNWNHTAVAPAGYPMFYQAVGDNFCPGDGDYSDPVSNNQYPVPAAPSAITATNSAGNDYVAWAAVPNATSYTITQTVVSSGASNTTTVVGTPPLTYTNMADTFGVPATPPITVTYTVAATGPSMVMGPPSAAVAVTPTVPPPPNTGLVGWWAFAEGAGRSVADSSVSTGGHTGTINNGTWVTGLTTTPFTNGVTLNGSSSPASYIGTIVGTPTNLPSANTPQSISWWMMPASTTGNQTIIAMTKPGGSGYSGVKIGISGGKVGAWLYQPNPGAWSGLLVNAPLPASATTAWHHYVWTFNPGVSQTNNLYIDGSLAASSATPWTASAAPTTLEFGRWVDPVAGGSDYYRGSIADIRIYTQALSATDVNTLHYQP